MLHNTKDKKNNF